MGHHITTRHAAIRVLGPVHAEAETVLTPDALAFVAELTRRYRNRIRTALARRIVRRVGVASGDPLDFSPETEAIRGGDWRVAEPPPDLRKRIVEIIGPVDRRSVIRGLNSGADVFVADLEDASSPTWHNMIWGQINLRDAARRTIRYRDPGTRRRHRLNTYPATLMVRPRGLHLVERHLEIDGAPVPAALFDFGLFVFHNARILVRRGSGPYLYLPKLEGWEEAELWRDIFDHTRDALDIPPGALRAAVIIETLPAAFQMDEILHALRDHAAGLTCGYRDYVFSFMKTRRHDPAAVLPDRSGITTDQPFLRAYSQLAVKTAHRRGVHCIGGMAVHIPDRQNRTANQIALDRLRMDKLQEVQDGHDGTWVAHPELVPVARDIFATRVNGAGNLIDVQLDHVTITAPDLLAVPEGSRTGSGLRENVRLGIRYLESWLQGTGSASLDHRMEDVATAELCRTQVWHWLHHGVSLEDGDALTVETVNAIVEDEMAAIESEVGADRFRSGRFADARQLFLRLCDPDGFEEFLTLPGSDLL